MGKECSSHSVLKWGLPLLVSIFVGCLYGTFLYVNIIPQLQLIETTPIRTQQILRAQPIDKTDPHLHKASVGEVLGVTIAFHVLFFLFLLSFFRSIITHPGSLPTHTKWQDGDFDIHEEDERRIRFLVKKGDPDLDNSFILRFLRLIPLVERKKDKTDGPEKLGDKRKCKFCIRYKPDRCHHCRICNSCVLRMDHHCPWIANCVGFHNYKFFLLLLLYALCCLAFILGSMFPRLINVFQPIMDIKYFLAKDMVVIVTYIVCFFFFITLAMFFAFHLWLVVNAMTTIEYREKSHYRHTFRASHIKFDYGYYQNFLHIFGPPWMWFLPLSPPSDHFVTLQENFLRSLPASKNSEFEAHRQRLLAHFASKTTRKEYIREAAGSYYTPLPNKFPLYKLSFPELQEIPDEKPSAKKSGKSSKGVSSSSGGTGISSSSSAISSGDAGGEPDDYVAASPVQERDFVERDQQGNGGGVVGSGVGLSSDEDIESEEEGEGGGGEGGGEVMMGEDVGVVIHDGQPSSMQVQERESTVEPQT